MEKKLRIFNSELPYISPLSKEEIKGNEHYMASTLAIASRKIMSLDFCVLFLIHRSIDPEFEDYNKIEIFYYNEPYISWTIKYIKGEPEVLENISGLILHVPSINLNTEQFLLLEAYYKCTPNEDFIEISIPLSKIRAVRFQR